jgi:hypothetical protein
LYNLIVSGLGGSWDDGHFSIETSRFLEHTASTVKDSLPIEMSESLEYLKRFPAVFAYEIGVKNEYARVGWIKEVRVRQNEIRFNFEFDEAISPFTSEDIVKFSWEFDLNNFEIHRTHWAVKEVDLF